MTTQLDHWRGDFGRAYTDRNDVDHLDRVATLRRLIPAGVQDVVEVGCNKGHNLLAVKQATGAVVRGVEPGDYARELALESGLTVVAGDIYRIPYEDDGFDLAMTSGVLIHTPPDRLDDALREMVRVARRYVLAIEYHSPVDEEVEYRGLDGMLWRRDYGAHYLRVFPDLTLRAWGDLTADDGFERARYWLLEKP